MHEYKVVPAPVRATKVRGLKTTSDRFAHTLTEALNDLGAEGWEFLRSETLPCEERKGWFGGTRSSTQIVLVFRRALPDAASLAAEPPLRRPKAEGGETEPLALRAPTLQPAADTPATEGAAARAPLRADPVRPEGLRAEHARADSARAEPVFRSGAMHRAEGDRRFPPIRQASDDDRP